MQVGPRIPVGIQLERDKKGLKLAQLLGQLEVFLTPAKSRSLSTTIEHRCTARHYFEGNDCTLSADYLRNYFEVARFEL
jgi:hypothetical protein